MIKHILFDIDGVLVQGAFFTDEYEKKYGTKIDMSFFKSPSWQQATIGKKDLATIIEEQRSAWNYEGSAAELMEYWYKVEDNPDPEVVQKAGQLKESGYGVHIATQQEAGRGKYIEEVMFPGQFDSVFVSAQIGFSKRDVSFYEKIIEELSCQADEILFIDDKQANLDVAKELGMWTYLFVSTEKFLVDIDGILKTLGPDG